MKAQIKDISLNYEIITPEHVRSENTVLLFLHEALGSIGQWKNFPKALCEQLQISGIVYERQGHGKSSPFTQLRDHRYLHKYALEELPAFIEIAAKGKDLILVGHSDGGSIALLYAHQFPEKVQGIITMAAHVINEPETIAGIDPAAKAYEAGKLNGLNKYHGDKTEKLFYAWADTWRSDKFKTWSICDEIGAKQIPGIFIQGADDQYGTIKQLELILDKFKAPSKYSVIDNCGHHPHLEQTNEVISQIQKWISDSVRIS